MLDKSILRILIVELTRYEKFNQSIYVFRKVFPVCPLKQVWCLVRTNILTLGGLPTLNTCQFPPFTGRWEGSRQRWIEKSLLKPNWTLLSTHRQFPPFTGKCRGIKRENFIKYWCHTCRACRGQFWSGKARSGGHLLNLRLRIDERSLGGIPRRRAATWRYTP